ncbi:MAG: hypothetical protein IPL86_16890 [Flavobacteriales bacterium]|nr:hypothetical protein [Flavobacteriales bacterium]
MTYQALGASGFSGSLYYIDDISVELATSLPIELLSFDAECESGATQLHWTTASEHNSDHFEVERSEDILDWQVIGTLTGAGNSQQTIAYSFTDPEHFDTTVYYRFKEIDTDGPFSYSPVVASTTCGDEAPIHQWVLDAMGRICGTWPVTGWKALCRGLFGPQRIQQRKGSSAESGHNAGLIFHSDNASH